MAERPLTTVILLFGVYAIFDGGWTIAAGTRASTRALEAWPVVVEGVVSVGLGALALLWPFVPRQFMYVIAGWGIATGALELLAALYLPRTATHWLLATGGFSSLFLAFLILLLPYADTEIVVRVIAAYAEVFGIALLLAAIRFPGRGATAERLAATRG